MAFERQNSTGRIVSTLVVFILLAVALGLYLQIVLVDRPAGTGAQSVPQASVQVLDGDGRSMAAPSSEPLPDEQMQLIMRVFGPEPAAN